MKQNKLSLFLVTLASGFLLGQNASANTILTEEFVNYATGRLGDPGIGQTGGTPGWYSPQNSITVTNGSGSLDGTKLGLVESFGDRVFIDPTNNLSGGCYNKFCTQGAYPGNTTTNITLYYSFLYQFDSYTNLSSDGQRVVQVNRQNSGYTSVGNVTPWLLHAKDVAGKIQLGISKYSVGTGAVTNWASTNLNYDQLFFVVVKETIVGTNTLDTVNLWVNPATNSFGASEGSVPTPDATVADGADDTGTTGVGRFYILSCGQKAEFDELRIANTWADVTPWSGQCVSASIYSSPSTNTTQVEGIGASFAVAAVGTGLTYQWQVSGSGSTEWTNISGAYSPSCTTPNLWIASDNGKTYRCIVYVPCDNSYATSAVATVTLTNPIITPTSLILDDFFSDLLRTNTPVTTSNSVWYTAVTANLDCSGGSGMVGTPVAGSATLYLGYFVDDANSNLPVHLDINGAIKVTLQFTPNGFSSHTYNGPLRFGLFDYADGDTRIVADSSLASGSLGNGANVRGYMLSVNFGTNFTANSPLSLYVRNGLGDNNLMGTTDAYASMGSGPVGGGYSNAPAFQAGTNYTLEFQVTRTATNSVTVAATITGGGANWAYSATETNYANHRFDAFGIRPNSLETTADSFTFTEFKVEVVSASPVITIPPASQTVLPGTNVTFSVFATGSEPLSYQWRLNGANIPGATNFTYSITNVQPGDGGNYDVLVANPFGAVASLIATLKVTVAALPFADNFADRGSTNGLSGVGSGSNTNATREASEPYHAGKYGNHSVWLQWTAPANGVATISTRGSSFDTLLAVYTGTILSNLTVVAANDDEGNGRFSSRVQFNAAAGTNYIISVDGLGSANGDIVLSWNLVTSVPQIPMIVMQPADVTVSAGGTAFFSVSATGNTNLSYQWYFNDSLAISNATSPSLTVSNVGLSNVGLYRVKVTSAAGPTVFSEEASLEIGSLAGAHSFDKLEDLLASLSGGYGFLAALSGGFPSVAAGSLGSQIINNFNSTTQQGEPIHSDVVGGSSRWYLLTATDNSTLALDTMGSAIHTVLAVYTGSDIFSLRLVASDRTNAPDGVHSLVRFLGTAGTNYLIAVDGVNGAQGNINLDWKVGVPPCGGGACQNQAVCEGTTLALQGGDTNAAPAPSYRWLWNGTNIAGATNATYSLTNIQYNQGGTYSVVVSNLMGVVTNVLATVSVQSPLRIALEQSSGAPAFRLTGSATQATLLQLSTNLTSWTPLWTNPNPSVPINYLDTNAAARSRGFYRHKSWP